MRIVITFENRYFSIAPDILKILTVKALHVENAINLFNSGIEILANDIQSIENFPPTKLLELKIKPDLSNCNIQFELDATSWADYKKYLTKTEGTKIVSAKRRNELFANGNISIIKTDTFYDSMLSGDVMAEVRLSGDVLQQDLNGAASNSPFYDKKVVFTGVLESISRGLAAEIVKEKGGDVNNSISGSTNFVIVGVDAGPSKMRKIDKYNSMGAQITILTETEFLQMIGGN